jgi:hypothetical protein
VKTIHASALAVKRNSEQHVFNLWPTPCNVGRSPGRSGVVPAIAFQLTGLTWSQAKFRALSCSTGTGFTTRESELIIGHSQRRKIASIMMVLGHAGLVIMIATFANTPQPAWPALGL